MRRHNLFRGGMLSFAGLVLLSVMAHPYVARASVILRSFTATAKSDGTILVEWVTETELDTVAFRLYRAQASSGPWNTVINQQPSRGDGSTGATYVYSDADADVARGITYYYLLEGVSQSGASTKWIDFIRSATVPFVIYLPLLARAN